jgi:hypothetical protein
VPKDFKYRAFLSYSRANAGVAEQVGRCLERFRLERGFVGLSAPVSPIFRDQCECFARASLGGATAVALACSAALIIVASLQSARGRYVGKQVKLFKLWHPGRPVIVLVVEGARTDRVSGNFLPRLRFAVVSTGRIPRR